MLNVKNPIVFTAISTVGDPGAAEVATASATAADADEGATADAGEGATGSGGSRIRNKGGGGGTLQAQWNKFTFTMTFVILEHVNVWALRRLGPGVR